MRPVQAEGSATPSDASEFESAWRLSALSLVIALALNGCSGIKIHGNYCGPGHPPILKEDPQAERWSKRYDRTLRAHFACWKGSEAADYPQDHTRCPHTCDEQFAESLLRLRQDSHLVSNRIRELDEPWWQGYSYHLDEYQHCLNQEDHASGECASRLAGGLAFAGPPPLRDFSLPWRDDLDRACREHDLCWRLERASGQEGYEQCNEELIQFARSMEPWSSECELLTEDVAKYFKGVHPVRTATKTKWWRPFTAILHIRLGSFLGAFVGKPLNLYKTASLCCDLKEEARQSRELAASDDPCVADSINTSRIDWVPVAPERVAGIVSESVERHQQDLESGLRVALRPPPGSDISERVRTRFEIEAEAAILAILERPGRLSPWREPGPKKFRGWVFTGTSLYFASKAKRKSWFGDDGNAFIVGTGQPGPENQAEEYPPLDLLDLPFRKLRVTSDSSVDLGDGLSRPTTAPSELIELLEEMAAKLAEPPPA
ncbi:MAG: hypothetical protein AAF604_06275 [Acidobacteriota bacterium]